MTSPAIDFLIFGSGRGLGAPYWNQPFYWLVDAHSKRGDFYTYSAGFGAQLHSYQWRHPKPQERRRLAGMEFAPFHSRRRWGRVEVANIVHAERFNKSHFADDTEFADWAQSRARHQLAAIDAAMESQP